MSDRSATSPQRAFATLNELLATNLRRVNRRILSPSSARDTFIVEPQQIPVQDLADTSAPFTTIASLVVDAGSWLVCGTTSIHNDTNAFVASVGNEVVCRLQADGETLTFLDFVDPFWFIAPHPIGRSFAPITRATFSAETTVTLEVRVSSDNSPPPEDSVAERTRLLVSPY